MLDVVFLLIAFVCFLVAAFDRGRFSDRVNVVALGLAAWVLVPLHHAWPR